MLMNYLSSFDRARKYVLEIERVNGKRCCKLFER